MASSAKSVPAAIHCAADGKGRGTVRDFRVGLFNPNDGVAGVWGPSTMACAMLAIEELNEVGGICGRMIRSHCFSADDEADVEFNAQHALSTVRVDAIVGMHTSSVRNIIKKVAYSKVPYVYTPLYEGGETTPGVYAIGETPDKQLRPAIRLLTERYRARRWMLIGNDYIWPRKSHALAKAYLNESGAEVISEHYLHIGQGPGRQNFDAIFELIEQCLPDAILISLVGQDAIDFNRQFGRLKLSTKIIRLSCAIEENGLLAIGAENTDGLFVSSGYFAALKSEANMSFKERYYTRYGERAPTLNAIGQSTYEGMHFLAALASRALSFRNEEWLTSVVKPLNFSSVRGIDYRSNGYTSAPIYLAEAHGHAFRVLNHFI